MRSLTACLLLLLSLESVQCVAQNAVPECQIAPGLESQLQGNSGCMVVIDNKMLIVRQRQTGKLSLPAGTARAGESAQCTAHRETWEETGVEVTVGRLLKEFDNQFYLFRCSVTNEAIIRIPKDQVPVPVDWLHEVSEVFFLNPTVLSNDSWRFPEEAPHIREIFQNIVNQHRED